MLPPNLLGAPVLTLTRYKENHSGVRVSRVINVKTVILIDPLIKMDATSRIHCLADIYNYGALYTTTTEKFENSTITTSHFGFVFEENSSKEVTSFLWFYHFRKAQFSKCFPSTLNRKGGVFKFLQFEDRFRKAPFSKCFPSTRNRKADVFKFLQFDDRFRKAPFSISVER